jgi:hypothetical protein
MLYPQKSSSARAGGNSHDPAAVWMQHAREPKICQELFLKRTISGSRADKEHP